MATSGEMVARVAELFGANVVTVESIDRALSNAGLRRKGGRGRSAAKMTGSDVANLTLAMILDVGMREASVAVGKVSLMPKSSAVVQFRPDVEEMKSAFELQVDQYKEFTATTENLDAFPAGAALAEAPNLGEGLAAVIDRMASGEFDYIGDMSLNMQMISLGPSATIAYSIRAGTLRVRYEAVGDEQERPVFERRLKLDEGLLWRLADIIKPA